MSGEVGGGAFDAFIVGCIVFYEPEDEEGLIWEALTYVKPVWRRRGVYRKLWTALVKEVQERHVTKISGSVHVENFGMRAAALKIGRRCNFMIYDYEV
jgi:ribosomal protein S18 acetylase RimI-like enzyme